MSQKLSTPCRGGSCKHKATYRGYCDEHKHILQVRSNTTWDYGRQWQRLRRLHLAEYPICVHCFDKGIVEAASEVHHIAPLSKGGNNAAGNLQSLCKQWMRRIVCELTTSMEIH